jgi:hypothetical protein
VSDAKGVEHVDIRCVISAGLSLVSGNKVHEGIEYHAQISEVQEWQHTAWKTSIEAGIIKPDLMIIYQ